MFMSAFHLAHMTSLTHISHLGGTSCLLQYFEERAATHDTQHLNCQMCGNKERHSLKDVHLTSDDCCSITDYRYIEVLGVFI